MPSWEGECQITVISACMTRQGLPAFAVNAVPVAEEEHAQGFHYLLVEERLLAAGYEEPFVHFDEFEAPPFLLKGMKNSDTPSAA